MNQSHDEAADAVSSISVVIPVYNAAGSLKVLLERLERSLRDAGLPFEAILVNDGSRDDSWAVIQKEAASRTWLRGIDLSRNFGQHNALLCGIRAARHVVIVPMDDDLQNPPEEIPRLLEALVFHVTVFRRVSRTDESRVGPAWRKAAGALGLALWFGVGLAGRGIAFLE